MINYRDILVIFIIAGTALGGISGMVAGTGAGAGDHVEVTTIENTEAADLCQAGELTAEKTVQMRERAQRRLAELKQMDAKSAVAIESGRITTVETRVQNGNLSYQRADYEQSCQHYQIAIEQSGAALERLYVEAAQIKLTTVGEYIADREKDGYASPSLKELAAEHEHLTTRHANVSSLSSARAVYEESSSLLSRTQDEIPSATIVTVAKAVEPLWGSIPLTGGLLSVIFAAGLVVGSWSSEEQETTGIEDDDDDNRYRGS